MNRILARLDELQAYTKREWTVEICPFPLGGRLFCYCDSPNSDRYNDRHGNKAVYVSDWLSAKGLLQHIDQLLKEPPF